MSRPHRSRGPGFTLVEICIVLAVAGLLAAIAWPSFQAQLQRGRRADGVASLMRLQLAQEQYHALHGLYAARLSQLAGAGATRSNEGLYDIQLAGDGGASFEAFATARAGTAAAGEGACAVLRLRVRNGVAEYAPSLRCWNR